jgi:hypothetical protein
VIAEGFEAHWQLADVQYEWVDEDPAALGRDEPGDSP